jgi:hemerythrin-like metal-binding protein
MNKIPDPNPYPWKKEYEVNNEMYDQQTHKFLDIINLMKVMVARGADSAAISEVFYQLVHYFDKYLVQEEIYLKELGYDRLERHIKVHREFADRIISFRESFENGETGFEADMYKYLEQFFDDHLMIDNRRAADFIRNYRNTK